MLGLALGLNRTGFVCIYFFHKSPYDQSFTQFLDVSKIDRIIKQHEDSLRYLSFNIPETKLVTKN